MIQCTYKVVITLNNGDIKEHVFDNGGKAQFAFDAFTTIDMPQVTFTLKIGEEIYILDRSVDGVRVVYESQVAPRGWDKIEGRDILSTLDV